MLLHLVLHDFLLPALGDVRAQPIPGVLIGLNDKLVGLLLNITAELYEAYAGNGTFYRQQSIPDLCPANVAQLDVVHLEYRECAWF
jgi:hypothetical protein